MNNVAILCVHYAEQAIAAAKLTGFEYVVLKPVEDIAKAVQSAIDSGATHAIVHGHYACGYLGQQISIQLAKAGIETALIGDPPTMGDKEAEMYFLAGAHPSHPERIAKYLTEETLLVRIRKGIERHKIDAGYRRHADTLEMKRLKQLEKEAQK